jgi:hypothetical protein
MYWQNHGEYLTERRELSEQQEPTTILVNERRNVSKEILESASGTDLVKGSGESKNWYGLGKSDESKQQRKWINKNMVPWIEVPAEKTHGKNKNFFRKRKIPISKKKNYPVKPITDVQKDKHDIIQEKYDYIVHSKEFEEMDRSEGIMDDIREEYLDKLQSEDPYDYIPYGEEYDDFGNEKGTLGFIEEEDTRENKVVSYDKNTDTYGYEDARNWADTYPNPVYLGYVMWCPPKDWIRPTIYWEKIWSSMDEKRLGYQRAYTFNPPSEDGTRASIQFHNSRM